MHDVLLHLLAPVAAEIAANGARRGRSRIGGAGQLLERSLIDTAVRFPERLVFEGPPELVPPLMQDATSRIPISDTGRAIDTRTVIPALTEYQLALITTLKREARVPLELRAAEIRGIADVEMCHKISERTGLPLPAARYIVDARRSGIELWTLLPAGLSPGATAPAASGVWRPRESLAFGRR